MNTTPETLPPSPPSTLREHIQFTATGSEYFRIWIVNVGLTLVTLGIYAAWAKVRTRRYFYRSTLVQGRPFEYHADPLAILRGNLIVVIGMGLYSLTRQWKPWLAGIIGLVGSAALPYLVWKSLRFFAHNSSCRNIRFRFHGTVGEAFRTWFLLPMLLPLTLGLIYPYWHFRRKKFVIDNFTYGKTFFYFGGNSKYYYKTYTLAALLFLPLPLAGIAATIGIALAAKANVQNLGPSWIVAAIGGVYVAGALLVTAAQQFAFARLTNYTWGETRLGPVRFESTLRTWPLVGIAITNALATLLTFGLFWPWARVRKTRYLMENLALCSSQDLEGFVAAVEPEDSAIGDSAVDFLNIEIGL